MHAQPEDRTNPVPECSVLLICYNSYHKTMGKVHKINDQKLVVQRTVITTVKENHRFYGA
jgi:hypothetical protein